MLGDIAVILITFVMKQLFSKTPNNNVLITEATFNKFGAATGKVRVGVIRMDEGADVDSFIEALEAGEVKYSLIGQPNDVGAFEAHEVEVKETSEATLETGKKPARKP